MGKLETVTDFIFEGSKVIAHGDCSHEIKRCLLLARKVMTTLESPLDCKKIHPVHPKRDQSWLFIGRTDAEAETPILGHLMRRVDSLEKTQMLGGIGGRKRRG